MSNKKILIVEDEKIVARNIQNRVENVGYAVVGIVSSGEEAIQKTKELYPALILMDIKLDGELDGIETASKIKADFDIPIVYLTAYTDKATTERVKRTEPFGYLIKPFEQRELETTIEIALYKHKLEKKLKTSEERYRSLLENLGDVAYEANAAGEVTYANKPAEQLTGKSLKDILGKPFLPLFIKENHKKANDVFQRTLQGESLDYELIFTNKKVGHFKNQPLRDKSGKIIGVFGIARDITERKKVQLELKKYKDHLEELVEERTVELKKANLDLEREISERKRTQEQLTESEEKYRNIIELAPDTIITADLKGYVTSINKAFLKNSGFSKDEIVGKHFSKLPLFDASDITQYIKKVNLLPRENISDAFEFRWFHKDGSIRFAEIKIGAMKKGAKTIGFQAISRDITERKWLELELRTSEENYRQIFNAANDAVFVHDAVTGDILDVNQTMCDLFGYSHEEVLLLKVENLSEGEPPYTKQNIKQLIRKGAEQVPHVFEWLCKKKDGTLFWSEVSLKRAVITGQDSVLAIARDITERKQAEEKLRESEEMLKSTISSLDDLVFVLDKDGIFLNYYQPSKANELFVRPEELIGKSFKKVLPAHVAKLAEHAIDAVVATNIVEKFEYSLIINGKELWYNAKISMRKDSAGNFSGVTIVSRNITERKQEEKLRSIQHNLSFELSVTNDLEEVFDSLITACLKLEGIDCGGVYLIDKNRGELNLVFHKGLPAWFIKNASHFNKESAQANLVKAGEPVYIQYQKLASLSGDIRQKENLKAAAIIPVKSEGRVIAVVNIASHTQDEISSSARKALESIALQISSVIVRIQAETALRDSEKRYRLLVETLQEGLVIADPGENIIFANPAFCNILGYCQDEIIGKNLRQLVPAEEFRTILTETARRKKGIASQYEHKMKHKNNELRYIRVSATPWLNKKSEFKGTIGLMLDITERKRAEAALLESEQRFRGIAERSVDGIFALDLKGRFTYASPAIEWITGYAPAEIMGKFLNKYLVTADISKANQAFTNLKKDEKVENLHLNIKKKDESIAAVEINASAIIKDGKKTGVQGIVRDISERLKMAKELQTTNERYRVLYEENPSMYFTVDTEGTVLSVNQFGAAQLGYSVQELVGEPVLNIFYEDDKKDVLQQMKICLQNTGEVQQWQFRKVRKDGSIIYVKEIARTVHDSSGNEVILIVCEDITEYINTQHEKEKLRKQLADAEKLIVLGQFSGVIAHELNNPLDIILTKLYLLQKYLSEDDNNPELWNYVFKIKHQVLRMSNIAKEILNYVKPRSLILRPVDVNKILEHTINLLSDYFTDTKSVEINLASNIDLINGDALGLELVFKNIILNAIESLSKTGKVTVASRLVNKNLLQITISDNGKGIAKKDLAKIFDPFFTSKRDSGGSGLGLMICREIIKQHNGEIKIKSELNKGTSAIIRIPLIAK